MLYSELKRNVLMKIGEYSANGTPISESRNADYLLAMQDTTNQEVRKIVTIAESKEADQAISHYMPVNSLGRTFNEVRHTDEDIVFTANNINSYSFYAVGAINILVEGYDGSDWVTINEIDETQTTMTLYNELLVTEYQIVRIILTGTGYYNVKWIAMFEDKVLVDYKPTVNYALNTGFYTLRTIVKQYGGNYKKWTDYKYINSTKEIVFDYYAVGDYIVYYNAYPNEMVVDLNNLDSNDSFVIDVDDEYLNALIISIAASLKADVDKKYNVGDRYDSIAIDQLNAIITNQPKETENDRITDVTEGW